MEINDVVQFNEYHKWWGCLGIVEEVKHCGNDKRYRIGVPIPERGTASIYVLESENAIEHVGYSYLGCPIFDD